MPAAMLAARFEVTPGSEARSWAEAEFTFTRPTTGTGDNMAKLNHAKPERRVAFTVLPDVSVCWNSSTSWGVRRILKSPCLDMWAGRMAPALMQSSLRYRWRRHSESYAPVSQFYTSTSIGALLFSSRNSVVLTASLRP